MKNKFKLFTGISFGVALCAATSLPLTMTFKDYNSSIVDQQPENKHEAPILKDNISFSGSINQLMKTDGRSKDVNDNLDLIFNSNKKALIENYDKVEKTDFETLQFRSEILNWNDWGSLTFYEWKLQNGLEQYNQENQPITEVSYDKEEIIDFISKDQLKSYLEENLKTILDKGNYPNVKLADADFGISDFGDLLIPITNSSTPISPTKTYSASGSEPTENNNKLILKIPSDKINFSPQIRVSGSYGDEINKTQIEAKEVSFECEIINDEIKPITFTHQSSEKKIITLKDKGVNENNILLYDTIKDEDVYKALGWLDESSSLLDHVDGDDMDISYLNEEIIYSDLGINKETDELLGIKLEFINGSESRNVNNEKYNGEYKITIETIDISNNYDINLKFKTYEVVSEISKKTTINAPLQLLVPNAYLLDTSLEDQTKKFSVLDVNFLDNKSFEMGFKKEMPADASLGESGLIDKNLQNETICKNFVKKIMDAASKKNIKLHNELNFQYISTDYGREISDDYKDIVTFSAILKQGFVFKDSFTITINDKIYKYNIPVEKSTDTTISFRVNCSPTDDNSATIWKNAAKSVKQIETELSQL